jgi:repressor LexA
MEALTKRQQQVYDFIDLSLEQRGLAPTLQEIAAHLQIKGNVGVIRHLEALERKGFISRSAGLSRGIRLTGRSFSKALPIVGAVAAGPLTEAFETIEGYLNVDTALLGGDGCFALRVRGESMIEAQIADGDYAIVRPQNTADNGDIVVAMLNGEATLKRFFCESGMIRLQPENSSFAPIILTAEDGELLLIGKVTGIVRALEN